MNKLYSLLLISLMLLPLTIIPERVAGQVVIAGVNVKAGTYDFYNTQPITTPVVVSSTGSLRIIIDRIALGWLGDYIRLSFILDGDRFNPNAGGYFLRVSNIGDYGPIDPTESPYGGVIKITENSTLTDEYGNEVGNVTLVDTYVIIWLKLIHFDLSNVIYISNVYTGYYRYENLYEKELRAKVFKAEAWDAAVSTNTFSIIPIYCSDIMINVNPYNVVYGDNTEISISFHQLFNRIYNAIGIELNVAYNFTRVTMYNKYDFDENYVLVEFDNGVLISGGYPVFDPYYVRATDKEIIYNGIISDFAPSIDDPNYDVLVATYEFMVEYMFVNESVDISTVVTSECVSTIDSSRLHVLSSLIIIPQDVVGNNYINPGDYVEFIAHNVPYQYLGIDYYVTSLRLINYTVFDLVNFIYINYYSDGVVTGTVVLDELPYGGYDWLVRLMFSNDKYIEDGYLTIVPYIEVYVLTSESAYAEDYNGYYYGRFNVPGDTSAPGDYIVIEGHGFQIDQGLWVYLNDTPLVVQIRHLNNYTGEVYVLVKLLDNTTYQPIAPGNYKLLVGVRNTPNNATIGFNVVRSGEFTKVLFNPEVGLDTDGFYVKHYKLGYPYVYFDVKYPFENDQFYPYQWPYDTDVEIISWLSNSFTFKLYNKDYDTVYEWFTINLTYGYGSVSLTGRAIPFLPHGEYTLLDETLRSVNDRTVFTVYMSIDIDVDLCRGGYFNVTIVGGAPNTNYTLFFNYSVVEITYGVSLSTVPYWIGEFTINVLTNNYGYGYASVPLTTLYPTDYVSHVVWDTIVQLGLEGEDNITFVYRLSGSYLGISPTNYYESSATVYDSNYSTIFHAVTHYNITKTYETVGYIPRYYFVISVPEVVTPGQNITVQIFPHYTNVWDLIVVPQWLWEETFIIARETTLYARLVDPVTNAKVDETNWYRLIVEDVDEDGVGEVWFVTVLKAPFVLGYDRTYRVDIRIFAVTVVAGTQPTGINVTDEGCYVYLDINGTIILQGYDSLMMIGGDKQIVTVLGAIYGEVLNIRDNVVEIKALVNNLITLIETDVMQLLQQINDTVAFIKGDVIEIKKGVATLITNVSTLINMVTWIDGNVSLIVTCCGEVKDILNRVESKINDTYTVVLRIDGNLSDLINTIYSNVIPKFNELYNNLTIYINTTGEYVIHEIEGKLNNVNESLYMLIVTSRNELNTTLHNLINTVLNRIDRAEESIKSNVTLTLNATISDLKNWLSAQLVEVGENFTKRVLIAIEDARSSLESRMSDLIATVLNRIDNATGEVKLHIDNKVHELSVNLTRYIDNKVTNIILAINSTENRLANLISAKADELKLLVGEVNSSIIACIGNVRFEVITSLKEINATLYNRTVTLELGLVKLSSDVAFLKDLVNNSYSDLKITLFNINSSVSELLISINDTLVLRIRADLGELKSALSDLSLDVIDALDNTRATIESMLTDTRSFIETQLRGMITNVTNILDTFRSDVSTKIDDSSYSIMDKQEATYRELAGRTDRINVNLLLFSSAILLMEIIILAIVGYGFIARRAPVG
ncbi:MAG: hypothetical protein QW073_01085 [Desulfurococcaceae archaeon]